VRRLAILIYSENAKTVDTVADQLGSTGRVRVAAVVSDVRDLLDTITDNVLDAIYVDLDSRPTLALDAIEEAKLAGTLLLTGAEQSDSELLVRAMRLGARDFFLHHDLGTIAASLRSSDLEAGVGVGSAPVLAVVGAKGGVGATTVACELAISFARASQRTAIVDLSRRIGDVAIYCDMQPPHGIADVARRTGELDADFLEAVAATHASGVSIISAANDIEDVASLSWAKLDRMLKVLRVQFDVVVLDLPWDFDEYSIRAVHMADTIIQVTSPDVLSLTHARIQRSAMSRLEMSSDVVRTVVNRLGERTTLGVEQMAEHLEAPIVACIPDAPEAAGRCLDEGLTFRDTPGGEPVVKGISELRNAVADWFQIEITEKQKPAEDHHANLMTRLRGWIGRG